VICFHLLQSSAINRFGNPVTAKLIHNVSAVNSTKLFVPSPISRVASDEPENVVDDILTSRIGMSSQDPFDEEFHVVRRVHFILQKRMFQV